MSKNPLLTNPQITLASGALAFFVAAFLFFRADFTSPSSPASGELIVSNVFVSELELLLMESFPPQLHAVVKGEFPDGCYELAEVSMRNQGNHFYVDITAHKPSDVACRQSFKSFEEVVPLDITGLSAGPYQVTAGSLTKSFTLTSDIPAAATPSAQEATAEPEATL
jgi:inhibitor of cysteine peptidase